MSAAVAYFIYGVSFAEDCDGFFGTEIKKLADQEILDSYYSSYDDNPVCLGVKLCWICESDEINVSELILAATPEQKVEYEKRVTEFFNNPDISGGLKELLSSKRPTVFIMWGSC